MRIKPKKSLGQNFLVDPNIRKKIIAACDFSSSDCVLEIGPGKGELTELIAKSVAKLYAIEIDPALFLILKEKFKDYNNVKIIKADILKANLSRYFAKEQQKFKVFGNIPYNITTPIIWRLFKFRDKIDLIFLTVQKEFAKRITAAAGSPDYGAFSCFAQYYSWPQLIFTIKRGSFYPSPKVDSSFLRLTIRDKLGLTIQDEKLFFKITRKAFNQRRKTLVNSLSGLIAKEKLESFLKEYGLDNKIRAEKLSLENFRDLTRFI